MSLAAAGEQLESTDLAVASAPFAGPAVATGAGMVVVERGRRPSLGSYGLTNRAYLALPSVEAPTFFLPLDCPAALRYALRESLAPPARWKRVRNRLLEPALARGLAPASRLVNVAQRGHGEPFLVAAAHDLGIPRTIEWFLAAGQGDALSRGVFQVFERDALEPRWALKFARVPDYAEPFDRDERGLRLAHEVGGPIVEHAPHFLGRLVAGGLHASLESAAVGQRLIGFLHTAAPRREKLRAIEAVAGWTLAVARHTRAAPARLEPERDRLRQHVLPKWPGAPAELADELAAVPGVFQHRDLGSWNVVVRPGGFTVLDWEDAVLDAPPLWDLWYLLEDALAHLDGAAGPDARESHFVRLFRGELPASAILFRWTRQTVEVLDLPVDVVSTLATLCWLNEGLGHHERVSAIERYAPGTERARTQHERMGELWLSTPGLGLGWNAWRL
ncbi:MAG: aminoglycoside phosphotransferase family protein [Gaiellaceae bacterium]